MAKPLRCWFGRHKWQKRWDDRKRAQIKECELCGKLTMASGLPPGFMGGGPA
jgi:hypothetical protein